MNPKNIVIATILLLLLCGTASAWLSGYDYRQPLNLTGGTSGSQTDYQIEINVTFDSAMQTDFDDLRFTNSSDVLIDVWLKSKVDSSYALVWAEFPTTPANGVNQTYYMYYGNSGAASAWNGTNTFIFFDDFEVAGAGDWTTGSGSPDYDNTTQARSPTHSVALSAEATWDTISRTLSTSDTIAIDEYVYCDNLSGSSNAVNFLKHGDGSNRIVLGSRSDLSIIYYDGGWQDTGIDVTLDAWKAISIYDFNWSANTCNVNYDGNIVGCTMSSSALQLDTMTLETQYATVYFDDVRVRKYADSPATYEFGSEQSTAEQWIPPTPRGDSYTCNYTMSITDTPVTIKTSSLARFSSFTILPNGDYAAPQHGTNGETTSNIPLATSSDMGATWSETVLFPALHYNQCEIVVMPNGTVWAFAHNYNTAKLDYKVSNDNGSTWGTLQQLPNDLGIGYIAIYVGQTYTRVNNTIYMPIGFSQGVYPAGVGTIKAGLGYTSDNGTSWNFSWINGTVWGNEHGICYINNSFISVSRASVGQPPYETWKAFGTLNSDMNITWGPATVDSGLPWLFDIDLLNYKEQLIMTAGGNWNGTRGFYAWTSLDNGTTWEDSYLSIVPNTQIAGYHGSRITEDESGIYMSYGGEGGVDCSSGVKIDLTGGTYYYSNISTHSGYNWINNSWNPGSGNVTDSYNVRINGVWHNGTTSTFWNDTYTTLQWQNITVYAWNSSGAGTISVASISQNTQIPANNITLVANTYGFLCEDPSIAHPFNVIAGEFAHEICFSWFNNSGACWESYWSGDSYNSDLSIPANDAYFVLMDGTGETVSCGVRAPGNVAIPTGWYATYLGESTAKTLTQIKTDIQVDGDVTNLYTWDHNAGGTGAWISVDVTPSHSVLPNQGILINNMGAPYNWDGTVS